MKSLFSAMACAVLMGGCTYNAPVAVAPNLNVYSSYGDKLPGTYALYVEAEQFSQTVHATGYNCSAHTYPVDMEDAFRQSTIATVRELVDDVEVVQSPLNVDELARSGKRGQIIVRADSMSASVQFIPGFWTATAEGHVELTANLTVDGAAGRLLGTTGQGEGTAQSDAGAFCGGGADAMAQAAEKAVKQVLGQLGERLSNSPRLRAAVEPSASPLSQPTSTPTNGNGNRRCGVLQSNGAESKLVPC